MTYERNILIKNRLEKDDFRVISKPLKKIYLNSQKILLPKGQPRAAEYRCELWPLTKGKIGTCTLPLKKIYLNNRKIDFKFPSIIYLLFNRTIRPKR